MFISSPIADFIWVFQVGEILKKDKSSCTASVQLLQDRDTLLTLDYDVICEYTGDIQAEFDYWAIYITLKEFWSEIFVELPLLLDDN